MQHCQKVVFKVLFKQLDSLWHSTLLLYLHPTETLVCMFVRACYFIYTFSPNLRYSCFSTWNHLSDSTRFPLSLFQSFCDFFFLLFFRSLLLFLVFNCTCCENPDRGRFPVGIVEESRSKMLPACVFISSQCDVFCRRPLRPPSFHLCPSSFQRGNQVACPPVPLPPTFLLPSSLDVILTASLNGVALTLPAAMAPGVDLLHRRRMRCSGDQVDPLF